MVVDQRMRARHKWYRPCQMCAVGEQTETRFAHKPWRQSQSSHAAATIYSRLRYFRRRIPIRRPLGERLTRLTGVPAEPPIVKVREELLVVASPDPVVGFMPR